MELIRRPSGLRPRHRPCVATLGAFDGVHRGHQAVIEQLRAQARSLGLPSTIITFEPLPREYLQPETAPARLMTLRERIAAIAEFGIDQLLCLRFDEALRTTHAADFTEHILVQGLGIKSLILGDDARFGHEREAGESVIAELGQRYGYEILPMATVKLAGERISSTRVRAALAEADFPLAEQLLGSPYSISGRVVHGRALGRELGAPTANIPLRRLVSPLAGVYAVTVSGAGLSEAPAVANIGVRPTIGDRELHNLEVHVLDGSPALYGQRLIVTPRGKLRGEKKFESLDALRAQIAIDMEEARQFFVAEHGESRSA